MNAEEKKSLLLRGLSEPGCLAVAFSGGTDSAFLLRCAQEALGDRVCAITAVSVFVPEREIEESRAFCERFGIRQLLLPVDVLSIPGVKENPADRCYRCKRALFGWMLEAAAAEGFDRLADGSNADDAGDYRPGMRAIAELGVLSPLREAGLTKAEIRTLSKQMGLPTWDKPSSACLASRIAYGEALTEEGLGRIDRAEALLHESGFSRCRVRVHGELARIEVPPEEIGKCLGIREGLNNELKKLGFRYVTLDLQGYRTGSMNETLT